MENSRRNAAMVFIAAITEDLLHNILLRLPAKSFAFASCVNRSWNSICNRILSRPKMVSAFSQNPDYIRAIEEALDKVLSEPIRPHFVIANITYGDLAETLTMITERVGSKVPVIASLVSGVLGKEACNDHQPGEVKLGVTTDDGMSLDANFAILLTVGYFPGMKVDVIPVVQSPGQSERTVGYKFLMDIKNYVSEVSDQAAPACVMLFGEDTHGTEPIVRKLDYAMPAETIIVGDQKGEFLYKRANESRIAELKEDDLKVLAGLIIARDRHRPAEAGRIQFHSAISRAMAPVNLKYRAANVSCSVPRWPSMFLTAKRRGEAEVLRGEQVLDDIENTLGSELWDYDPYLGVTKRRKYSVGSEKSKIMSSLVFHELTGADEKYLTVNGAGIKMGDVFQVYCPDHKKAEASLKAVSSQLKNLTVSTRERKIEVVGGFIFACNGRGACFFNRPNVDSAPILENFPELPFGGIFCSGEIRSLSIEEEEEEEEEEESIRKCLHVYSSVYLIVSFTSP